MARTDYMLTGALKALVLVVAFGVAVLMIANLPATAKARGCVAKDNGTRAAERLVGTVRSDCMRGGGGSDRIIGRAGGDSLHARDGRRDRVRCGHGRDTAFVDRKDRVSACEKVRGRGRGRGGDGGPGPPGGDPGPPSTDPGVPISPEPDPAETSLPPSAAADPCAIPLAGLIPSSCELLLDDPGAAADPTSIWGIIDCEEASRHSRLSGGGDLPLIGSGTAPANDSYRRLTVLDGDDVWGERCELGRNNHVSGPTTLYREGQRRVTSFSLRLAESFPLATQDWQLVMQMKQTQPSANGGGTPVISLLALKNEWRLQRSTSAGPSSGSELLWSAPAQTGRWTRFSFDVNYSQDPSQGSIKAYLDLNGDGDSADPGEQSPKIQTYTLKRETEGGSANDGIAPGQSIPSHLRIGPYHSSAIPCPPPNGCSLDLDNVKVVGLS